MMVIYYIQDIKDEYEVCRELKIPCDYYDKINQIPFVLESMIYGRPDKNDDLDICAKIVYNEEEVKNQLGQVDENQLHNMFMKEIKAINKTMPAYKYVRDIVITNKELIKTTTQKIKRFEEMKTLNIKK